MPERQRRPKGSGGITRRKDGTYQGTIWIEDSLGRKAKRYVYARTQAECRRKLQEAVSGPARRPERRTVDDLLDHVLGEEGQWARFGRQTPKTLAEYRRTAERHIRPMIGDGTLAKLQPAHIDDVLGEIVEAGKLRTAQLVRVILKLALDEGVRLGWVETNAADRSMRVSVPKAKRQILNLAQVVQLVEASEEWLQGAVLLAGLCGLRESEIAGLMWGDVGKGTITIRRQRHRETTKTEAGTRTIALPEIVAEWFERHPKSGVHVFPGARRGKPVHPSTIYHKTMESLERAGLPKVTFHDLRHSANNILKQLGVDAATRRDILGHASTNTTENVYTQTVDREIAGAMRRLDRAIRSSA